MRRITALIVVLAAPSAAFPLVASAITAARTAARRARHVAKRARARGSERGLSPRCHLPSVRQQQVSLLLVERQGLDDRLVGIVGPADQAKYLGSGHEGCGSRIESIRRLSAMHGVFRHRVCLGLSLSREQLRRTDRHAI